MGKSNAIYIICFFLFIVHLALGFDDGRLGASYFPDLSAKSLIRGLNLFPDEEVNIASENDGLLLEKRLVEKPLKFPGVNSDDEGISVEDFGHHAGYYKISRSHAGRMFYLFFESRGSKEDPVVIWLTGGPGCSSELAMFYENGPFSISNNLSLVWNKYGWDKVSNLLYVDQPMGTGFSYTSDPRDIRHNENEVSDDLYDFLQAFFEDHPEFVDNDFYITGESYAGHYVPAIASRVHKGNKARTGIHINLKGFAIGNGLTDPAIQYEAYIDFALDNNLITQSDYDKIKKILPLCELSIKLCGTDGTVSCMASYFVCNSIFSSIMSRAGDINYYDIRKKCVGSLCYDFSNMEKFLHKTDVREALGVGSIKYVSCSPVVYQAMLVDWMRNLEVGIPELLEDGIKALIYAGECDLICNWLGNSRWVHAMKWSGHESFVSSPETSFQVDGAEAGVLRSYGPLAFLKVHDAGHMVPMDQPQASLEMLDRWMKNNLTSSLLISESKVSDM